MVRSLAARALDQTAQKPIDVTVRLVLFLQSDPDYTDGTFREEAWNKERLVRASRWLTVWRQVSDVRRTIPEDLPQFELNVAPPPETGLLIPGVAPERIKDPVLRKRYEDDIKKNADLAGLHRLRRDLDGFQELLLPTTKRYLTEAYCKAPYNTPELEKLLSSSSLDAESRAAILAEVRRRTAERPERPVPPPVPTTPKAPPSGPITWRTDPRLKVPVSLDLKSPTVDDVLRELRQATGVDLSRADDVQRGTAVLGSLSTRDMPAWQIMEQLASSKRVEGTWQPAGDGYRLISNGTPPQIDDPGPASPAGPGLIAVLLVVLGSLALVLLVAATVSRYRRPRPSP
jgi:hypothetical protein